MQMQDSFAPTGRTRIKRLPARGRYDHETVFSILDEGLICHVAFDLEGTPNVIPTGYVRVGEVVYIHGSPASRLMRAAAGGGLNVCVSVTLVDGLVLARSAMHHSMNYRCVVMYGRAQLVTNDEEKIKALRAFVDHVIPGRWSEIREPNPAEMKATDVLSLTLGEVSAKVRTGPPLDDPEDYDLPVWAGIVPADTRYGLPIADPRLPESIALPEHLRRYKGPAPAPGAE